MFPVERATLLCVNLTPSIYRSAFPVDAVRTSDEVVLTYDLPGFRADDVDVTVENHVLTLTARRTQDELPEGAQRLRKRFLAPFPAWGFLAPKGPKQVSPGQRPGCRDNEFPVALKGRNKERTEALPPLCCALSGLKFRMLSSPRAALRG